MDSFRFQLLQGERVRQWFTATLNSEWNVGVTDSESLSVNGTNRNTPIIRVDSGELRNVAGYLAIGIALALPVNILDVLCEALEIRDHELIAERLSDQGNIVGNNPEKCGRKCSLLNVNRRMKALTFTYALNVSRLRF